jgi:hypothetical protein
MSFSDAVTAMVEGKRMQPVPVDDDHKTHAHYYVARNMVIFQGDPTRGDTNPPQEAVLDLRTVSLADWQEIPDETKILFGLMEPVVEPTRAQPPPAAGQAVSSPAQ